MDILQEKDCWVCMYFEDGSVRTVHTTLNSNILAKFGAELKKDHFFDLDHGVFVPFRNDAVRVVVEEKKPVFEQEVLRFASRFI